MIFRAPHTHRAESISQLIISPDFARTPNPHRSSGLSIFVTRKAWPQLDRTLKSEKKKEKTESFQRWKSDSRQEETCYALSPSHWHPPPPLVPWIIARRIIAARLTHQYRPTPNFLGKVTSLVSHRRRVQTAPGHGAPSFSSSSSSFLWSPLLLSILALHA